MCSLKKKEMQIDEITKSLVKVLERMSMTADELQILA